jgi:hypothetical protein
MKGFRVVDYISSSSPKLAWRKGRVMSTQVKLPHPPYPTSQSRHSEFAIRDFPRASAQKKLFVQDLATALLPFIRED